MSAALEAGFADPVLRRPGGVPQRDDGAWRGRARSAASRPCCRRRAAWRRPPPALALALCDHETPLWLDPRARRRSARSPAFLRFHTGAPIVANAGPARFALLVDASRRCRRLETFAQGTAGISRPLDDAGHCGRAPRRGRGWRCRARASHGETRFAAGPLPRRLRRAARRQPRALPPRRRHRLRLRRPPRRAAALHPRRSLRRPEPCMSPSRAARRPSTTPTRCSPTRAGATGRAGDLARRRSTSSSRSPSTA